MITGDALELEPVTVAEWDAEDLLSADLSEDPSTATAEEARAMFDKVTLTFPPVVLSQELLEYADARETPLGEAIRVDRSNFDFHLMELPLNILLPEDRRLVRLKLSLEAAALGVPVRWEATQRPAPVVAYDLFPADTWDDRLHDIGEVSVDVSKALTFVCPAPLTDAFGLKLSLPLRWRSRYVRVRTSDRLSNPLEWYVNDQEISNGFTGYAIWRVPKRAGLGIEARLLGEVRSTRVLGRRLKARFGATRSYIIGPPDP